MISDLIKTSPTAGYIRGDVEQVAACGPRRWNHHGTKTCHEMDVIDPLTAGIADGLLKSSNHVALVSLS